MGLVSTLLLCPTHPSHLCTWLVLTAMATGHAQTLHASPLCVLLLPFAGCLLELWAKSGALGGTAARCLGQVLPAESCLPASSAGPSLSVGSPPAAVAVTGGSSRWQCDALAIPASSDLYSRPRSLPRLSPLLLSPFPTSPSSTSLFLLLLAASPSSHAHRWPLCLIERLARKPPLIFLSLSSPDSLFPLDIGAVKNDHSFLDQDSLKSLCR